MIVLIKLILAHLIGDFILQPHSWVVAKERKKLGAYQLYLHALIHGVLIMLFVWEPGFLKWAVCLTLGHLVIDAVKLSLQTEQNRRMLFFCDQLAHLLFTGLIYIWYQGYSCSSLLIINDRTILLLTAVFLLSSPVSIAVKIFISRWSPQTGSKENESLQSAGKYIGILERLLVFVFVINNNWEAIGFLIAAKSIFRFGDLKEAKDLMLTEYILIGTLLSFSIAIFTGIAYQYLIMLPCCG